jgi:murein L,D-transpeptidase YcbB/YkuD
MAVGAALLASPTAQAVIACPPMDTQDTLSQAASAYLSLHVDGIRKEVMLEFYQPCGFVLAWTHNGNLTPQGRAIVAELANAEAKGLRSADYGVPQWNSRICAVGVSRDERAIELARFDVDLTAALMLYISDLVYGRTRPRDPRAGYNASPDQSHVASLVLSEIVSSSNVPAAVQQLEPPAPGYLRTEAALQALSRKAHEFPDIVLPPFHGTIRPGDSSKCTEALIARLVQLGELHSAAESIRAPQAYDGAAVTALRHFQTTHGLVPTGIIDAATWRQLAVPMSQRVNQLALTLERWRWVPHTFNEPPIVVNIPEYRSRAYDDQGHVALSMPVIVGRAAHRNTPVLQAKLTQVMFHPYWNVPRDIQVREIAPHVIRNRGYLSAHDYQVIDRKGAVVREINAQVMRGIANGSLRVRQTPGRQNALGAIKFFFPNAFDVYMHGTPQQSLFAQNRRDFSHGCIRVEDPASLAVWVLRKEGGWTRERISDSVQSPRSFTVTLSHPIPVLVVYGTGIAAEDGNVKFFDDIYGYDASLERALSVLSRQRHLQLQYPK